MKIVVTKKAVREYIREMLETPGFGWETTGDTGNFPVEVSSVVDPSAPETDPGNPNFKPRNRMELRSVLATLVDEISDDDATNFYDTFRGVVDKNKEEEDMKKDDKKVEEAVRLSIRKLLREMGPYRDTGMSYSGPMTGTASAKEGFEECEACEGEGMLDDGTDCTVCKGKGMVPSKKRKNKMMTDVGGASFKEIAQEMGYASESGAKQAVEKALEKARFVMTAEPDEVQIITLTAMNDYINMLNKSGELTAADVQLMKDHPNIVAGLDGFREFLDKALKKAQKTDQKVLDIRTED
jgi:hypothetical protein